MYGNTCFGEAVHLSVLRSTRNQEKEVRLHVHHLESRKVDGDAPDNQVTLCESCHEKLHKGLIAEKDFKKRKRKSTRDATFMGIMRKTLMQRLCSELPISHLRPEATSQRQPERSCWCFLSHTK